MSNLPMHSPIELFHIWQNDYISWLYRVGLMGPFGA